MRTGFGGVLLVVIACVGLAGCASEKKRPQEPNARAHLSPRAKKSLSSRDVDEIAQLIAQSTEKQLMAVSAASPNRYPNAWDATIGYWWGTLPSDFGICVVTKKGGTWQVLDWADSLSADQVGASFADPPE